MPRTGRPKVERVSVECAACNAPMQKYPSDVARNKTGRFFCSAECRNKVGSKPRKGKMAKCVICETPIYVPNWSDKKLCSRKCADEWNAYAGTTTRQCLNCGSDFEFRNSMSKWNAGKFCSHECNREYRRKEAVGNTYKNQGGYIVERTEDGYALQHRLVMERHLGRPLRTNENVHHVNGVRDDNQLSNLELWVSSQPSGQRPAQLVEWARNILEIYGDEVDAEQYGGTDHD